MNLKLALGIVLLSTTAFAEEQNQLAVSVNFRNMNNASAYASPADNRRAEKIIRAIHKSDELSHLLSQCKVPVGLVIDQNYYLVTSSSVAGGRETARILTQFSVSVTNYSAVLATKKTSDESKKGIVAASVEAFREACGN